VKEREHMAEAHTTSAHGDSTRFYWIVAAVLAVITIVEVIVSLNGVLVDQENPEPTMQAILLIILLILAAVKGAGVVMFFMHLRGDARVFQLLFIAPFALASSMIVVFLALFSGFVGIGG
jgi:cytochrome c oxidase subunit IV